jgi:hypothetical protein
MESREWASQKAKEVREKRARSYIDKETRLLEEKQRSEATPRIWQEFVDRVSDRVKCFNDELGEESLLIQRPSSQHIKVGTQNFVIQITAELDSRLFIRCMLVNTSAEYQISVLHGQATLVGGKVAAYQGEAITPDRAAEQFLNSIIGVL